MNYRFLSALAFVLSIYTSVKAENLPKATEKTKEVSASLKIGYVDIGFILESLPEAKKNNAEMQSFQRQLQNQMQTKGKEYEEKLQAFQQQQDTLTEAQKKQKAAELRKLELDYRTLEEQQFLKMQEKQNALMTPLYEKIEEVIRKIAEEHGYSFILRKNIEGSPINIVLFAKKSFDLSEFVLEKLKAMAPKEVQLPVIGPKPQASPKVPGRPAKPVNKK